MSKTDRAAISRRALAVGLAFIGGAGQVSAQTAPDTPQGTSSTASPSDASGQSSRKAVADSQAPQGASNDIIVTATRQNVASQRVPISLTAVGTKQLATEAIVSPAQLGQLAPGLFVLTATSEGVPRFTLRGLALTNPLPSASPTVATYVDDVYQNFQRGISTAIYDLQRVEVLRGPQGTTFGRNTTGGAVAYYSQQPTNVVEGYVNARVAGGDQAQRFLQGALNIPLVDGVLAVRASGHIESRGNYTTDSTTGNKIGHSDNESGRIQLKYTPSSRTTVNLIVSALRRNGDSPFVYGFFPTPGFFGPNFGKNTLPVAADPERVNRAAGNDYRDNFDNQAVTLRADQELGQFTLTSITHYRHTKSSSAYDLTGVAFPSVTASPYFPPILFDTTAKASQYGEELRLSSDPTEPLSGLIGGYYERDKIDLRQNYVNYIQSAPFSYDEDLHELLRTTTYAAFANVTWKVFPELAVIGGVRKTYERKTDAATPYYFLNGDFNFTPDNFRITGALPTTPTPSVGPYNLSQKNTPWTWDGTVNFTPTRTSLFFVRLSKGFRSGGFNPAPLALPPATPIPTTIPPGYGPESVRSYEGGFKLGFADNRVRVNGGIYHYDYSGQQVTTYVGAQLVNQNAARSKVDGGELEVSAVVSPRFSVRGSAAYTNARYSDFPATIPIAVAPFAVVVNYAGNRLQQAPRWTLNGGFDYSLPVGEVYKANFNATGNYRSRVYFDNANDPYLSSGPMTYINLRLGFEPSSGKGLSAYAFVNNLLDNKAPAGGFTFIPNAYYNVFFETGRSIGLDVGFKF